MNNLFLNRNRIIYSVLVWWLLVCLLHVNNLNPFQIYNILAFAFLVFVPGLLTLFLNKIKEISIWAYMCLAIGISILELITISLLGNLILPNLGYLRPLSSLFIFIYVSMLILVLLALIYRKNISIEYSFDWRKVFKTRTDIFSLILPVLFTIMSVVGAQMLNNTGNGWVTYFMLVSIALYLVYVIFRIDSFKENNILISIYLISLALLLMTSFRGWHVSGHDIVREYYVFKLTKVSDFWSISTYKDAYNACMSITILPTIFSAVLKISDHYVYKFLYQLIFAFVPTIVYLGLRKYVSKIIAFLSVLYFVSFPTFFNDMPMLNRQEIAFLYLALMIYVVFEEKIALKLRKILFVIMGFGMIFSHYSTTYTVLALLILLLLIRPIAQKSFDVFEAKKIITLWMVVALILGSFFWTSILTDTSSNSLYRVIKETFVSIKNNTKSDSKSSDVLYSLFSWKRLDINQQFNNYLNDHVWKERYNTVTEKYFELELINKYKTGVLNEKEQELTKIGNFLSGFGLNVNSFNYLFRQISGKLLQLFIIIGFIYALFRKKYIEKEFDLEFMIFSFGSLVTIFLIIILPVLSKEYGLLRAFQQSLMFLGVFAVMGSLVLFVGISDKKKIIISGFLALIFFMSNTGIITKTLGGYNYQFNLDNEGKYYDGYYIHESEMVSIEWLSNGINKGGHKYQPEIQADSYNWSKLLTFGNLNSINDIYPYLVQKDSYIYLGNTNVNKKTASVAYNGDVISYSYPVDFLDNNKSLIYNNGDSKIYK